MSQTSDRTIKIFGFQLTVPLGSNEDEQAENIAPLEAQDGPLFVQEELPGITFTEIGMDCIEVNCGCTTRKYGDYGGILRVYRNGSLEITCTDPNCKAEDLTPIEFEKHAQKKEAGHWKSSIWVMVEHNKRAIGKTNLLKYYLGSASDTRFALWRGSTFHRDEFLICNACGKMRRFVVRTKDKFWLYHKASLNKSRWTCKDYPCKLKACTTRAERVSKQLVRGCPRKGTCRGCTRCVCFGCTTCRFDNCSCRTCMDFVRYSEPNGASSSGGATEEA